MKWRQKYVLFVHGVLSTLPDKGVGGVYKTIEKNDFSYGEGCQSREKKIATYLMDDPEH